MRSFVVLVMVAALAACDGSSASGPGGTSADGETCSASGDCLPGLRCVEAVCIVEGAPGAPDALGGADVLGFVEDGGPVEQDVGAQLLEPDAGPGEDAAADVLQDGDDDAADVLQNGDGDAGAPCKQATSFACANEKCACINDIPLPLTRDEAYAECADNGGFQCFEGDEGLLRCACSDDPAYKLTLEQAEAQCLIWIGDCDASQP